jgi:chitinase
MPNFQQFREPVSQEPWLFDGSTFWTFDDPTSIAFKMNYLKSQGLAGAMLWNLDQDTSTGTLIQAVHAGLQ